MKKLLIFVSVLALAACAKQSDEKLTAEDSLKLKLVKQENVSYLGAPPLIPADHPVEIGGDISLSSNGGEDCLECHNDPTEEDATQTLHPERVNCMQCHIQQAEDIAEESELKVENEFRKVSDY